MLQLTMRGPIASSAAPAVRDEFLARGCVRLTSFLEPRLFGWVQSQIAEAEFVDRAHGTISTELCMQRNVCLGLLNFLVNDPIVLRFVEQMSGCRALTGFVGRVYRVSAGLQHADSWHADLHAGHEVGMSVNLGIEPFDGGVFEIRRSGSAETLAAVANIGPGDAILFPIGDGLEHRISPMRGPVAKTALAGWFGSARDYRDVVRQETHPRRRS